MIGPDTMDGGITMTRWWILVLVIPGMACSNNSSVGSRDMWEGLSSPDVFKPDVTGEDADAGAAAEWPPDPVDLVQYVDPMIGTKGGGNVIPGALAPHGMVRVSPNTREAPGSIDAYEFSRTRLDGFAHAHLEGPGGSNNGYSHVLIAPTVGEIATSPEDYASTFSHDDEEAAPGYYAVTLDDPGVRAEVTAAPRAAIHRYTFPATDRANLLVDLGYSRGESLGGWIVVTDDRTLRGCGDYTAHPLVHMFIGLQDGYSSELRVCFHAVFSRSFEAWGTWDQAGPVSGGDTAEGAGIGAWVTFTTTAGEAVEARVGLSYIDEDQARDNLAADVSDRSFEVVREETAAAWNALLNRVRVEGGDDDDRVTFYTALYHSLMQPADLTEAGGRYLINADGTPRIEVAEGWRYHTDDWCMWDTFRTSHPLGTLVEPERRADLIRSMLRWYELGGWLPKCTWRAAGYSRVMIANPAVPIIADAIAKGFVGFDLDLAWEAAHKAATQDVINLGENGLCGYMNLGTPLSYIDLGYVPHECDTTQAASMTLEYAHDDWCTAVIAEAVGRNDDAAAFRTRSGNWKNHWNPQSGFLQGRTADGDWLTPFDPADESEFNGWCEATSWIYTWFVPHDVEGLIEVMGGPEAFIAKLDQYFDGGHHDPSNQPGFHIPFLYNLAGAPGKTGGRVRTLREAHFGTDPGGLPGNDDAGAMSAWYVLAAMGLYPICPGDPRWQLVPPAFDRVTLHLHPDFAPGNTFTIERVGEGDRITEAALDGVALHRTWITHDEIIAGGTLRLSLAP